MTTLGRIAELWRYPVKSMGGERLDTAHVGELGVHADRCWALWDERAGVITGAKKLPALLSCSARYASPPPPDAGPGRAPPVVVTLPDATELESGDTRLHARLSELVGRAVRLIPLPPRDERRTYRAPSPTQAELRQIFGLAEHEPLPDLSMFPISKLAELAWYTSPVGTFYDAYPVHVLTTSSLAAMQALAPGAQFDVRRFRPNVLIDTGTQGELTEVAFCGGGLRSGTVELRVEIPTIRCSMPTRAQPGLRAEPEVIKTVAAHAERCLGVYATVARPGSLHAGDEVSLDPPRKGPVATWAQARTTAFKRFVLRASNVVLPKE